MAQKTLTPPLRLKSRLCRFTTRSSPPRILLSLKWTAVWGWGEVRWDQWRWCWVKLHLAQVVRRWHARVERGLHGLRYQVGWVFKQQRHKLQAVSMLLCCSQAT